MLAWLDIYAFQATKTLIDQGQTKWKKAIKWLYVIQAIAFQGIMLYLWQSQRSTTEFMVLMSIIAMAYLGKFFAILFVFIDDIRRVLIYFFEGRKRRHQRRLSQGKKISRSKFLAKSAVAVSLLPVVTMSFGIVKGAYDYRVRRRKVYLPNLPEAFDGIKLGQLSDIHSGSFFD